MSLLDETYFDRVDCSIPQGTYNTLLDTISRYERDILIQILGYDLYKLVAAYANPGSDQRIIDLVKGKEYLQGDYTVKWNGLLNTDKVSLLAYYCYIHWIRDNLASVQNIGLIQAGAENGTLTSPDVLIQSASGKMRRLIGYPGNDIFDGTLYNFLMAHDSTYPEWLFTEVKLMNIFDI